MPEELAATKRRTAATLLENDEATTGVETQRPTSSEGMKEVLTPSIFDTPNCYGGANSPTIMPQALSPMLIDSQDDSTPGITNGTDSTKNLTENQVFRVTKLAAANR